MAVALKNCKRTEHVVEPQVLDEVERLKSELKAVILAHNYQIPEIQAVADFVGDSLELALKASQLKGVEYIFFCGVNFMAETAKILNPRCKVVVPDEKAGCPLADMITPEEVDELKSLHPKAPVVAYVNTTAAVKAKVDICCTSSNAAKVVSSLDEEKIIFVPDRNLGLFVKRQVPDKEIVLWDGFCPTHMRFTVEDVETARRKHPDAVIMVHPECREEVQLSADYVLSTGGMFRLPSEISAKEFVVGTENGMIYRLSTSYPDRKFYPLNEYATCPNMKKNTLQKLLEQMRKPEKIIEVEQETADRARRAIERMLRIS